MKRIVLQISDGRSMSIRPRTAALIAMLLLLLNVFCLKIWFTSGNNQNNSYSKQATQLYLLDEAEKYVYNVPAFEQKVRTISQQLEIPPEWLMAVMHSESRFDASVKNRQGSGATGIIQFMPNTASDLNITTDKLRNMNHMEQLDFVFQYLQEKQQTYRTFETLTDLYLAILYPAALNEQFCYTLYANPEKAYIQNKGLDIDKDGKVNIQDVDRHLQKKYPSAYLISKETIVSSPFKTWFSNTATLGG